MELKHLNYLNNIHLFSLVIVGLKFPVKQEYNKPKTLYKENKKAQNFFFFTLKQFITELIYLKYFKAHSFL